MTPSPTSGSIVPALRNHDESDSLVQTAYVSR
jgi:hypothetical protein